MGHTIGRSKKTGLPPGSLVYTGDKKTESMKISIIDYDENGFEEKQVQTIEECLPYKNNGRVTWIDIDGLDNIDNVKKLGDCFGLHTLVLEDILTTDQRPKMEDFGDYIYMVLRMLYYNKKTFRITSEQISIILKKDIVISFQEREGDLFDPVRERLRSAKGRIRKMGADFLAYSLLDAIVDNHFVILEDVGESLEDVEEELVMNPSVKTSIKIHTFKRDMIVLRKSIWPMRELINGIFRLESNLISSNIEIYFRDIYDHTIQIIETVESFRDMLSEMLDIYLSSISNRMNEIMKVLTIIATIFIPLTFIVGVYGMNFKYMPELEWRWSYPVLWLIMLSIGGFMFYNFKKNKWL
ncbi:MAG: magnesium/cobalt transporter CorA [Chloroflexi bacterium]|nr:magnesium/cobalt transporter CorA [Chloroflexota bacterium]